MTKASETRRMRRKGGEPIKLTELEKLELENIQLKLAAVQIEGQQLVLRRSQLMERISKKHKIKLNDGWIADLSQGILHKPHVAANEPEGKIVRPTAAEMAAATKR